ncbi:YkvA family protein [Salinimicrobium soli]|uniref:YkvA family protein n=1 Tax=Salinimicrobium soli TaxID=1254399 RepID=UPI003AADE0F7
MSQFSEKDAEKAFSKRQRKFKKKDAEKIFEKEENLFSKFLSISNLKEYYQDFKDLFSLFKDFYKGNYNEVPWLVIASIGGALLYVLSPIDLIPDFIPVVGYLDDAAVFAACLKFVQEDLEKYRMWKFSADQDNSTETEIVEV